TPANTFFYISAHVLLLVGPSRSPGGFRPGTLLLRLDQERTWIRQHLFLDLFTTISSKENPDGFSQYARCEIMSRLRRFRDMGVFSARLRVLRPRQQAAHGERGRVEHAGMRASGSLLHARQALHPGRPGLH